MELVQSLYDFFGIELLTESTTFPEFISYILQIFIAVWLVLFIIRSMFLVASVGDRRLF